MNGRSRLQFSANGSATLDGVRFGRPSDTFEDHEPVFDWLQALGLPKDWDQLDRLSAYEGFSDRFVRFILADESPTRFPGSPRLKPQCYRFPDRPLGLTLAHLGYNIGQVFAIVPGDSKDVPSAEGYFLVGTARLFDSALADAAWRGMATGIFGHVCGVLLRQDHEPLGAGELFEVALSERPGCPGARILKAWEETDEGAEFLKGLF